MVKIVKIDGLIGKNQELDICLWLFDHSVFKIMTQKGKLK